jgi:hypothetical protein
MIESSIADAERRAFRPAGRQPIRTSNGACHRRAIRRGWPPLGQRASKCSVTSTHARMLRESIVLAARACCEPSVASPASEYARVASERLICDW